jgi:anti-sigma regulatory factor (Ser/Thr protein kinase)
MVAQPASVPAARRLVDEALSDWGRDQLLDDVALCVTELTTNATLHGGNHFEVEVTLLPDAVRVAVLDNGGTSAQQIANRADVSSGPAGGGPDEASMTGRGLFIVSVLASDWGIEDQADGTRIWADFRAGAQEDVAHTPAVLARPTSGGAPTDPPELVVIELNGCPPDLLLAHDENLADIVRELQLVDPERLDAARVQVREDIADIVRRNAVTWDAARLIAREALRLGRDAVDISVLAPLDVATEVARLREAVSSAEQLAARGELITLPAAEPIQTLRDWMEAQFVGQTARGQRPVSFPEWLEARAAHPS